MNVARDALVEIASRLRERCLRRANAAPNPPPLGPFQGFSAPESFPGRGPLSSGMIGAGSSSGYDHLMVTGLVELYAVRCTWNP